MPKFKDPLKETKFKAWYTWWANKTGISTDPDAPEHHYDYRGAYEAGAEPSYQEEHGQYRWPDKWKKATHPNIENID